MSELVITKEVPTFDIGANRQTLELARLAWAEREASIRRKRDFWGYVEAGTPEQLKQEGILAVVPVFTERLLSSFKEGEKYPDLVRVKFPRSDKNIFIVASSEMLGHIMRDARLFDKNRAQTIAAQIASGGGPAEFIVTAGFEQWKRLRGPFAKHFNGARLQPQIKFLRHYLQSELQPNSEGKYVMDNRIARRVMAMAVIHQMAPNFKATPEQVEDIMGTIERGIASLTTRLMQGVFVEGEIDLKIFQDPEVILTTTEFKRIATFIRSQSMPGDGGMIDELIRSGEYTDDEVNAAIILGIEAANGSTTSGFIRAAIEYHRNQKIGEYIDDSQKGKSPVEAAEAKKHALKKFSRACVLAEEPVDKSFRVVTKSCIINRYYFPKGAVLFLDLKHAHARYDKIFFQGMDHNIDALDAMDSAEGSAAWLGYPGAKVEVLADGTHKLTPTTRAQRACIGEEFSLAVIAEMMEYLHDEVDITEMELGGQNYVATHAEMCRFYFKLKDKRLFTVIEN
jgi:cytochrome P450